MSNSKNIALLTGVVVFSINTLENVFHYNIGKQNGEAFKFHLPTRGEFGKIILTSVLAGILVGFFVRKIKGNS